MTEAAAWLQGGGEMGALIRAHDWGSTALGAMEDWPQSLRTALGILLALDQPAVLAWGPELILINNDAHLRLFGRDQRASTLGEPLARAWPELCDAVRAEYEQVLAGGGPVRHENRLLPVQRHERLEDVYWTYSYSPVPDSAAPHGVAGVLTLITETPQTVAALRGADERQLFLLKLSDALRPLADANEIVSSACEALGRHLGVAQVGYAEMDETGAFAAGFRAWTNGEVPNFTGDRFRVEEFGSYFADLRAGRNVAIADVRLDERTSATEHVAALARIEAAAIVAVPLAKAGRPQAFLYLTHPAPRQWSAMEVELVREVAERTWAALERARAEAALRASEERLRNALEIDTVGVLFWGPDFRLSEANQAFLAMSGFSHEEALGLTWQELTPPEFHAASERAVAQIQATGRATPYEKQYYRKDGSRWWGLFAPRRLADGDVVEFALDVSDRREKEQALRASEEQLRLIVESARDYAIFTTDPGGRIRGWYPGAQNVFGWSAEEAAGASADMTFTPEDREKGAPQMERAKARDEGSAPNVRWHVRKDGSRVFIEGSMAALRAEQGELTGFLKIGQDVTARMQAQEHERMLLAELQHRVRNTLAVVRSIALRTAESSETSEEMSNHLQGRLAAFSRVQAVVTRKPGCGVDLNSLIQDELLAHAMREGPRLRIEGSDISLQPKAAESISLAIHELATNAVKYGALACGPGRLEVKWSVRGEAAPERLHFEWLERDSTPPARQGREGFGTELLLRSLPYELDAETRLEFGANGMRFEMTIPADRVLANAAAVSQERL